MGKADIVTAENVRDYNTLGPYKIKDNSFVTCGNTVIIPGHSVVRICYKKTKKDDTL